MAVFLFLGNGKRGILALMGCEAKGLAIPVSLQMGGFAIGEKGEKLAISRLIEAATALDPDESGATLGAPDAGKIETTRKIIFVICRIFVYP